jgi:hypothetical protein
MLVFLLSHLPVHKVELPLATFVSQSAAFPHPPKTPRHIGQPTYPIFAHHFSYHCAHHNDLAKLAAILEEF